MSDKIQILIEIDKNELEDIIDTLDLSVPKKPRRVGWSLVARRNVDRLINLLKNSILPENTTNGDVFNSIIDVDNDCIEVEGKDGKMTFTVTQEWWNALYKGGKE